MKPNVRLALIVGGAAVAAITILLALTLVPVPQHFSLHDAAIYDPNYDRTGNYATKGTTVTLQWSAPSQVYFFVVDCTHNGIQYSANGTNGSGSFESSGAVYQFSIAAMIENDHRTL